MVMAKSLQHQKYIVTKSNESSTRLVLHIKEMRYYIKHIKQEKQEQPLRHPLASKQLLIYLLICTPIRRTKLHKQQRGEDTLIIYNDAKICKGSLKKHQQLFNII